MSLINICRASKKAAEDELGFNLPGPFDHVMFSVENCYGSDCSWAAYGGINSWFTVYKADHYKYPAVAMHGDWTQPKPGE